ncbi:AAA family ATPase [Pseudonocardia sp. WMMC193]|uniref:AAA family ATPase n=1 Tax=Pseudonocardia sp. WMMC193 TaxID=2911965 RepID=UPI001F322D12|nr:AAA family ATPase [Pseudonocardia sp. WMMC193]MCF7550491.1 AAA family ATPase [Pseudonocardia sp. WMMC193]
MALLEPARCLLDRAACGLRVLEQPDLEGRQVTAVDPAAGHLPHNTLAERTLLGSMLLGDHHAQAGLTLVSSDRFYVPAHQLVFDAIATVVDDEGAVDHVAVAAELDRAGRRGLPSGYQGWASYLADLIAAVAGVPRVEPAAEKITDTSDLRLILQLAQRVQQLAAQGTDAPADLLASLRVELTAIEDRVGRAGLTPAEKVANVAVQKELARLRARDEAQRLLRAENRPPVPPMVRLREFLDEDDDPVRYRIDQLQPVGARIMLSAQYKAGKTTLAGNYLRCLADGEPFLGRYEVAPVDGTIALIDNELDSRTLRRWLRDQGVRNVERVALVSLRGRVSSFDIRDREVRAEWAERLRAMDAQVVLLDCLRPVLDALGLDEKSEAGKFLVPFDELLATAGASEAALVHHMGHSGERSRGDSRLLDWPDATWKLVREDAEDPSSPRFFSAYGRDVNVAESQLTYDSSTRRLLIGGGSRVQARAASEAALALPAVLEVVRDEREAPSGRTIEGALAKREPKIRQKPGREALGIAVDQGLLRIEQQGRTRFHYLTDAGREALRNPESLHASACVSSASTHHASCVSASIGDAHAHAHTDERVSASPDAQCSRCHQAPAEILGRCRRCAYPAGSSPEDDEMEQSA